MDMSDLTGQKSESYITIGRFASAEIVVEKSRFIAYAKPVSSREEALGFISEIRDKHKDATHNVPAYVIGEKQNVMWSSEDGEPQGTAGAPILKMLVQEGLTDVCMVITRYFGGIKLGTGGLVRAYTEVAKDALREAGRAAVCDMLSLRFSCDYKAFNRVKAYGFEEVGADGFDGSSKGTDEAGADGFDGRVSIGNIEYQETVRFDIVMPPGDEERVKALISVASGGKAQLLKKMIVKNKIMC